MPIALLLKALPYFAAIGLAFGAYFYVHHDGYVQGETHVQAEWDKAKAASVKAALDASIENQRRITELEGKKNDNLTEIDRLRANNHALWLRLPKTPCPGGLPSTDTTSGSESTVTSGGVVHSDVPSVEESALNAFDRAYSDEAYRADKLIEQCRVVVNWAKAQEK